MSKRILVISTSLREKSNSQALGDAFAAGAREAGHQVEQISLRGRSIAFCMGCLACQSAGQCVIAEKMGRAEVIAFATPIYYYEMSGQMKTLLDRANALFASDYAFRDIYLLTAAAEEDDQVPARAESGLTGWIDCFEKARLAGTVFAGGVNGPGETVGHPALERARAMGRQV